MRDMHLFFWDRGNIVCAHPPERFQAPLDSIFKPRIECHDWYVSHCIERKLKRALVIKVLVL
jgi:hypothetical protein